MKEETYDHLVKVLMIGESGVGKTCLIQRFNKNEFSMNHLSTIAIDFKLKVMEIRGSKLKMQIWDTAGQERFNTLTTGFFKGLLTRLRRHHPLLLRDRREIIREHQQVDEPDPRPRASRSQSRAGRQQDRFGERAKDLN